MLPVFFAQAIGEYGGVGSLMSEIQQLAYSMSARLGRVTPTEWIIGVVVVLGLVILSRR
jgi:hypothetical protein